MQSLPGNLRYALRQFRVSPVFTAAAVLTLRVLRLILGGAFKRVLIGVLLGLPLAVGAGRLISAQLYGVSSWDPFALTLAAAALATCSFFCGHHPRKPRRVHFPHERPTN